MHKNPKVPKSAELPPRDSHCWYLIKQGSIVWVSVSLCVCTRGEESVHLSCIYLIFFFLIVKWYYIALAVTPQQSWKCWRSQSWPGDVTLGMEAQGDEPRGSAIPRSSLQDVELHMGRNIQPKVPQTNGNHSSKPGCKHNPSLVKLGD